MLAAENAIFRLKGQAGAVHCALQLGGHLIFVERMQNADSHVFQAMKFTLCREYQDFRLRCIARLSRIESTPLR